MDHEHWPDGTRVGIHLGDAANPRVRWARIEECRPGAEVYIWNVGRCRAADAIRPDERPAVFRRSWTRANRKRG